MAKDVTRFPVSEWQRMLNRRGEMSVSCHVSMRWLKFDKTGAQLREGPMVMMHVMTDAGDETRTICEFCVPLDELKAVIEKIEIK